jgi:hypothetical protein
MEQPRLAKAAENGPMMPAPSMLATPVQIVDPVLNASVH